MDSLATFIPKDWQEVLNPILTKAYLSELTQKVALACKNETIFPAQTDIFNALKLCPFEKAKVVILGQDPYHGEGQAHGLAFSVPEGIAIPPSLRNIFKEVSADTSVPAPTNGNLERWATQGVLLLNSILTVEVSKAGSHQGLGWEQCTDAIITALSREQHHIVFMLWGNFAASKRHLIDESKHLVLTAPHPSPLSAYRGFFGCRHFSHANAYLRNHGMSVIKW